ncbi:hypothetical protein NC651_022925 [Populus alba x Populus x berolinensis]|nr:hypothetical protein NC651_022925 [Populus alba x Populus x berolinensis]
MPSLVYRALMNGLFSLTNSLNFDRSNATLGLWAYSASRLLLDKGFRENKVEKHQIYFKVLVSKKTNENKKRAFSSDFSSRASTAQRITSTMVLEATMICIDNSEWMRNGDYSPSRFQAQADAVNLLCGAKTQSNPEKTVGILTMAGKQVSGFDYFLLVIWGKILSCMHGAQMLETLGKKLKKNNVSLDIVGFGAEEDGKAEKSWRLSSLLSIAMTVAPHSSHSAWCTPVFTERRGRMDVSLLQRLQAAADWPDEVARQAKRRRTHHPNHRIQQWLTRLLKSTNSAADQMAIALFHWKTLDPIPLSVILNLAEATNEDQDLAMALQMSIQETAKDSSSQSDMSKALEDQSFVSSVLASLPGVDPNDPSVKELLASFQGQSESGQKKDEDKPPSDDK